MIDIFDDRDGENDESDQIMAKLMQIICVNAQ